jgi:hypothetical protein
VAEPITARIADNVMSALLLIDGTAPYYNTLGANNLLLADASVIEPENGPHPFVVVASPGSVHSQDDGLFAGGDNFQDEFMSLAIEAFITARTNVHRDLRRLEHDIRTALWQDPTRGSLALHTLHEETTLIYPLTNEGLSLVRLTFAIQFQLKLSDLTATIGT